MPKRAAKTPKTQKPAQAGRDFYSKKIARVRELLAKEAS